MQRRDFLKAMFAALVVGVAIPAAAKVGVLSEAIHCACGCGSKRGMGTCYTSEFWRMQKRCGGLTVVIDAMSQNMTIFSDVNMVECSRAID